MARRSSSSIFALFIMCANFYCMRLESIGPHVPAPIQQQPSRGAKLLALGDSYTIGEGLAPELSWPLQLAGMLRAAGFNIDTTQIIAATGWTTLDLLRAIAQTKLSPPYDLVTLLIGVNDQFQGQSASSYRKGFAKLLSMSIEFAGGRPQRVIVLSIPDYSVTPFGRSLDSTAIRTTLDRFNLLNAELSTNAGVHYVNITEISRGAASDPSLLAPDKLHPSGTMYAAWARLVASVAAATIAAGKP